MSRAPQRWYQMERHCSGGIKWSGTAAAVSNEQGTAAAVSNEQGTVAAVSNEQGTAAVVSNGAAP